MTGELNKTSPALLGAIKKAFAILTRGKQGKKEFTRALGFKIAFIGMAGVENVGLGVKRDGTLGIFHQDQDNQGIVLIFQFTPMDSSLRLERIHPVDSEPLWFSHVFFATSQLLCDINKYQDELKKIEADDEEK